MFCVGEKAGVLKRFFKDSLVYGLAGLASRSISIITLPLYTRILSPADFGVIDLMLMFSVFAGVVIPFAISSGVARYFPEAGTETGRMLIASSGFWFVVVAHSLFVVMALYFAEPLTVFLLGSIRWSVVYHLNVIVIVTNGMFYYFQNLLRWRLEPKRYVACSLASTLVNVTVSIIAIFAADAGVVGIFIGQIAGGLVGGLAAWHLSRELFKLAFSLPSLKDMLWFSFPLVPALVGEFVTNYIDRISIRTLLSVEDLGLYGIGFRFASIVSLLMIGFSSSLTPLVYANYQNNATRYELARIFRFFLVIALPTVLFMAMFSRELLWVLTTPAYFPAWPIIPILAPALLLMTMYNFAPGIDIAKRTKVSALIQVLTAAINCCLNILLIPVLGTVGSAIATLLSGMFMFSAYMYYSQHYYSVPHQWRRLAGAAGIVAALVPMSIAFEIGKNLALADTLTKAGVWLFAAIGIGRVLLDRQEVQLAITKIGTVLKVGRI